MEVGRRCGGGATERRQANADLDVFILADLSKIVQCVVQYVVFGAKGFAGQKKLSCEVSCAWWMPLRSILRVGPLGGV